jgi:hypothetical protein
MANEDKLKELANAAKGDSKKEPQAQSPQAGSDDSLPEKDELVSMSKADLDVLVDSVRARYDEEIESLKGHVERLSKELEKKEKVSYLNRRGQEGLKSKGIEINQKRALNPVDHQSKLVEEHKEKLKGKRSRFVTNNESLRSLRRAQGYEPVRDEDGNEVRYMDGVLMGIPERRYEEEIASDREYRKSLRRQQLRENFKDKAAESGMDTFGDIDFDDSPVHNGG